MTKKAETAKTGRKNQPEMKATPKAKPAKLDSKKDRLIEMLKERDGITIQQAMKATGWQSHSVHGFFSGVLRKKLGLTVVSQKQDTGERAYRIIKAA